MLVGRVYWQHQPLNTEENLFSLEEEALATCRGGRRKWQYKIRGPEVGPLTPLRAASWKGKQYSENEIGMCIDWVVLYRLKYKYLAILVRAKKDLNESFLNHRDVMISYDLSNIRHSLDPFSGCWPTPQNPILAHLVATTVKGVLKSFFLLLLLFSYSFFTTSTRIWNNTL